MSTPKLLVTGASGHLGQRVLCHLIGTLKVQPDRVVATTRSPASLAKWSAHGVDVRAADFDDDGSLVRAFRGADRLLLISTDAGAPGQRIRQHERAIAAAEQAGARHLIYTSMPEPTTSLVLFAPDHADTEAALHACRIPDWTVLRNHWYFENLLMLLPQVWARAGKWFSAAGDGKMADLTRDDAALAAAHALVGDSTGRRIYTISGTEALTTAEQAQAISAVTGRAIERIDVSPDDYLRALVRAGAPESFAQLLVSFDANVAAGRMGTVSDDFRTLTGRSPRLFKDWLAQNRVALVER